MKIEIQNSAIKDLKGLDNKIALRILENIKNLENYPNLSNIKKLKNYSPSFRYRVGDYRVLFDIEDEMIIVANIKHRKEAYK